jgi:hypothetical protein
MTLATSPTARGTRTWSAATLPPGFDLAGYEAQLSDAPADIVERMDGDEDLARLYMVLRTNGMQWGRQHVALCS